MATESKVTFENSNNPAITISALLYYPANFDKTKLYSAVIVVHPGGGVKEQTAGLYAKGLATVGLITIAYDASYQGESTGEPRHLENPHIRTEDISAVIDHITSLDYPYVNPDRIGVLGICAGGGYAVNAAINDRRIKAVGTISAVNIGSMFRNGWDNSVSSADALPLLEVGSDARASDAAGAPTQTMPLAPVTEGAAPNEELRQAWEYYHTNRAKRSTAPGIFTARSLTQLVSYDAFSMADAFLTQPLQIVVGSEAGSKWMSDDLYDRAASTRKDIYIIQGANHIELYDKPQYAGEASTVLAKFFQDTLA